jgi:hypothetical protein
MRQATRITLFVQSRDSNFDAYPDKDVLEALVHQTPIVTHNADGSRTLVFDLPEPGLALSGRRLRPAMSSDHLKSQLAAIAGEARAMGLPLTASLAEAAERVVEVEITTVVPPCRRG